MIKLLQRPAASVDIAPGASEQSKPAPRAHGCTTKRNVGRTRRVDKGDIASRPSNRA